MRYLAFIVMLTHASACGIHPCDEADYVVDGLCVIMNDYPRKQDKRISAMITAIEASVNSRGLRDKSFNMPRMLERVEASLTYVSALPGTRYAHENDGAIEMLDTFTTCGMHEFVLSHELLHIVAREFLHADADSNYYHTTPKVWLSEECDLLDDPDNPVCDSIEKDAWARMVEMCER
jgi:hypothetical protein